VPNSPWQVRTALALLTCLALGAAAQTNEEKARKQLQKLQRDIGQITREITSATAQKSQLQEKLRQSEVQAGTLSRQISENRQAIEGSKLELKELGRQQSSLQSSRDEQKAHVATELRSAWQLGSQGQLMVLLNQENPHDVARAMAYYRYLYEARTRLLERYRDTLLELQSVEQQISSAQAKLQATQDDLQQQQADLVTAQQDRQQALAKLNNSIANKNAQLKKLEADRRELQGLLEAIEVAVDKLVLPDNYQAFSAARGKMPWPVSGKTKNRYGRPRNEGKMRWQGLVIEAKEGSTVRAIHHGRVVYADWLRGYGLLLIIEHGDGYMSLYAHNQSLLREVGEWVTAGSAISTVGNSGGQIRSALYFEIRHDGKPTDPGRWCKG
jgi:septal ring factor EnvC (AmiA/AmiB activator)